MPKAQHPMSGSASGREQFETALRDPALKWVERLGDVDILVGIPTYGNEDTVGHVVSQVGTGLKRYFGNLKTAILVADGGSVDDTREHIHSSAIPADVERMVTIYRGIPGKGTSFRAVFECAVKLEARAILVFDSDLRSISPEWVKLMADPILEGRTDFCSPWYRRHPFDGTITNMIVYPLTAALFGKDIRQPIGGDFSFSLPLAQYWSAQPVWATDVARFGIDIWMTLTAENEKFRLGQVDLGTKIHNPKDPAADLGLMFFQVVSTLFYLMDAYEDAWRSWPEPAPVGIISGNGPPPDIPGIYVSLDKMKREFEEGFSHFRPMYRDVLEPENFQELSDVVSLLSEKGEFSLGADLWSRILYDFFFVFTRWQRNRRRLVDIITPLYFGRTGTFCAEVMGKSWDEAEEVVRKQVEVFRKNRSYLVRKFKAWE